jgi:hypothetical protein
MSEEKNAQAVAKGLQSLADAASAQYRELLNSDVMLVEPAITVNPSSPDGRGQPTGLLKRRCVPGSHWTRRDNGCPPSPLHGR